MCSKLQTGVGPLSEMTPLNTIFYFILKIKKRKNTGTITYNFLSQHSSSLFGSGGLISTDKLQGMKSSPDLVCVAALNLLYMSE